MKYAKGTGSQNLSFFYRNICVAAGKEKPSAKRKTACSAIQPHHRHHAEAGTPIPEPEAEDKSSEQPPTDQPTEPKFEPYKGKIRKPGTGCVTMINDHLYEGRFSPRVNGKRIAWIRTAGETA